MILHGDDGGLDIERTIRVAQTDDVGELQWRSTGEKNFARSAEFDRGAFAEIAGQNSFATAASQLHWDADRRGLREKARQARDRANALDAA